MLKKVRIVFIVLFVLLGLASWASADFIFNSPSYVAFYSDDDNHDNSANIQITGFDLGDFGTLQYNVAGTGWNPVTSSPISVSTSAPNWRTLVDLRVKKKVDNSYVYSAYQMVFTGENSDLPNHYDSLFVYWTSLLNLPIKVDFVGNSNGSDNLSPVPIPPTILLMSAGLVSLVGIRRRFRS